MPAPAPRRRWCWAAARAPRGTAPRNPLSAAALRSPAAQTRPCPARPMRCPAENLDFLTWRAAVSGFPAAGARSAVLLAVLLQPARPPAAAAPPDAAAAPARRAPPQRSPSRSPAQPRAAPPPALAQVAGAAAAAWPPAQRRPPATGRGRRRRRPAAHACSSRWAGGPYRRPTVRAASGVSRNIRYKRPIREIIPERGISVAAD